MGGIRPCLDERGMRGAEMGVRSAGWLLAGSQRAVDKVMSEHIGPLALCSRSWQSRRQWAPAHHKTSGGWRNRARYNVQCCLLLAAVTR